VHLDQSEVAPFDAGALERLGNREDRGLEQLPAGVDGGDRMKASGA